ncbi:MAG: EAL domain-containing protein [Anaerovoracaceae bacterium]
MGRNKKAWRKGLKDKKKFIGRTVCILVSLSMLIVSACVIFAENGEAVYSASEEKRTVVVGYPLIESVNEIGTNGYYKGYNYEYLQEIAKYTDFEYKFVMDSWENCMKRMEAGTIDLMGIVTKTPEREEFLYFPQVYAGITNLLLLASEESTELSYGDFDALQGKKVGIFRGNALEADLDTFLEREGIVLEKVYYNNARSIKKALQDGSVDLMLGSNFSKDESVQIVADINASPFYFAVSKNSPDGAVIFDELESAMSRIASLDSQYNQTLEKNYVDNKSKKVINFTAEEQAYIENTPEVRVVYDPSWKPIIYEDEKTGEPKGAVVEIMNRIAQDSGLNFVYIKGNSYTEALQMVKKGEADIICNFIKNLMWADSFGIEIISPYLNMPIEQIINEKTESVITALPKSYISYQKTEKPIEDENIQYFNTMDECFDAVRSGEAKSTYANAYVSNYMMTKVEYANLKVVPLKAENMSLCLGVGKKAPKELLSIIEKENMKLAAEDMDSIMLKAVIDAEDHSFKQWTYKNPDTFGTLSIAVCLIAIVTAGFYGYMLWKREKFMNYSNIPGVWNYSKFQLEAAREIKQQPDRQYVILHVNVSKFRFFNDTYGFREGDNLLVLIGKCFKKYLKPYEKYASLWADHFVCLLECDSMEELEERSKVFQEKVQDEILKTFEYRIILRSGAYFITKEDIEQGKSINDMLQYANHTLSFAKDSYQNSVTCFDESMLSQVEEMRSIEKDMMSALQNKEFVAYFQPKYDINTGRMVGAEALVRWQHPTNGLVPPGKFLPYCEKSGFIVEIDFYVFEETCRHLRKWLDMGKEAVTISCNFSQLHLQNDGFVEKIKEIAGKYDIPFSLLEVELTETVAMSSMKIAMERIKELHQLGFSISIDDFGSGYSSLSVLQELDVDIIKLDRTFLKDGVPSEKEYKIMEAIVKLAGELDMGVICEGVETADQVELLKSIRCKWAQGFYYAKPMPAENLEKLLPDGKN